MSALAVILGVGCVAGPILTTAFFLRHLGAQERAWDARERMLLNHIQRPERTIPEPVVLPQSYRPPDDMPEFEPDEAELAKVGTIDTGSPDGDGD